MLLAAHNHVRFDHVPQLRNFRVLVATKCRCSCAQVDDAAFNLLAVEWDETTVPSITPLSLKLDYSNFVHNYFGIR